MEIKDITEVSKPLVKLLIVFEDGCSWITKPLQHKRLAVVESKTHLIDDIAEFKRELTEELLEDTGALLHSKREKNQVSNIVNIFSMAAQELQMLEDIDENRVNQEWCALFFDNCKDVANDDIQYIWSRLLVKEIKEPSSVSKRTLSVLKNMEAFEVKWFSDFCRYAHGGSFVHEMVDNIIPANQIASLMDCGVLNSRYCTNVFNAERQYVMFSDYAIKLNLNDKTPEVNLECYSFTDAGAQLFMIQNVVSDVMFVEDLSTKINKTFRINSEVVEI